jgi:hypothetical protein
MQEIHKSESYGCLGTEKNVDNEGSSQNTATEEISSELKKQSSPCGTNLSSTMTHDKAEHIYSDNTSSEKTYEQILVYGTSSLLSFLHLFLIFVFSHVE